MLNILLLNKKYISTLISGGGCEISFVISYENFLFSPKRFRGTSKNILVCSFPPSTLVAGESKDNLNTKEVFYLFLMKLKIRKYKFFILDYN